MSQTLAAGMLTGSDAQNEVEYLVADFSHSGVAVSDAACVYVHIVAHPAICVRIAGDLDYGNRGKADGAAAPGSEGDQVNTAGREARQ